MKKLFLLAIVVVLCAGLAMAADMDKAVVNASSVTLVSSSYDSTDEGVAGNFVTEAGNISDLDLTATAETNKWAGFLGEVTVTLSLGGQDTTVDFHGWGPEDNAVNATYVSTDSVWDFSSASTASAGNLDTALGWSTGDGDSLTSTLTDNCNVGAVTDTDGVRLQGWASAAATAQSDLWTMCLLDDGNTAVQNDFAFGVEVNLDRNGYNNATQADYELMVPVDNDGAQGTNTYYFFLGLK